MKRAAIIVLGLWLGCDSRNLVVITSMEPDADSNEPPADAGGSPAHTNGHYHMENLDRGLVGGRRANGAFLSWRMFGYEYLDQQPERIAYAVYRDGALLATVNDSTNYLDAYVSTNPQGTHPQGSTDVQYSVAAIIDGETQDLSPAVNVWPQNYLRIPLLIPQPGVTPANCPIPNEPYTYSANDASVGDLDGHGRYEIVLKWDPSNSKDNSQYGCTGNVFLDAYTLDGLRLWRIDLGPNIRAGAHYTQHLVYDFDGEDGKAEVVVKTAPGTIDGTGTNLQTGAAAPDDQTVVYRNSSGYILTGPEYLTVFDGVSGAELATVDFQPARGAVADWATRMAIAWTISFRRPRLFGIKARKPPAVVRVSSWGGASTLAPRSARGIGETARSRCCGPRTAGWAPPTPGKARTAGRWPTWTTMAPRKSLPDRPPSMAMAPDAVRPTWATGWDCTSPISSPAGRAWKYSCPT